MRTQVYQGLIYLGFDMGLGPIGYLYYLLDPSIRNKPKRLELNLIQDYWALRGPIKPKKLIYIFKLQAHDNLYGPIRVITLGNKMMGLKKLG